MNLCDTKKGSYLPIAVGTTSLLNAFVQVYTSTTSILTRCDVSIENRNETTYFKKKN